MNIKKLVFPVLIFTLFFISQNAFGSILDWKSLSSDDFLIFYPKGHEEPAKESLFYLQKYQPYIKKLTGNKQNLKTRVVLQDNGLATNAYANYLSNKIGIYLAYPTKYMPIFGFQNWYSLTTTHENIHINQLLNISGFSNTFTFIYGNLFSPNLNIPRWILEGITVYGESQINPFEGRLNYGLFDTLISVYAKADQLPDTNQANFYYLYYPLGQYYLFGGSFIRYLANTYGEEKITLFFNNYSAYFWVPFLYGFLPFYSIDKAAVNTFGKSFPDLFSDWHRYEKEKAKTFKIEGNKLSDYANIKAEFGLTNYDYNLYFFRRNFHAVKPYNYYGITNLISYNLQTKTEKVLLSTNAFAFEDIYKINNKIFYGLYDTKFGYDNTDENGLGEIGVLHFIDDKTGISKELFSDDFFCFTVFPDETIIYGKQKKTSFGSEIWEFKNRKKKKIGDINELILEIKNYQDKIIVVSTKKLSGTNINFLNLKTLKITPIINTNWYENNIKIANNMLYFTANFDNKINSFKYDFLTKKVWKLSDDSYANEGLEIADNLYFLNVNPKGSSILYKKINNTEYKLPPAEQVKEEEIKFIAEPKKGNAFADNFEAMLLPSQRFSQYFLASGKDALGFNDYKLYYTSQRGIEYKINTKMFLPLNITYSNRLAQNNLSISYLLYKSSGNLLKDVSIYYNTDFMVIYPALQMTFAIPSHKLSAYLASKIEGGISAQTNYNYFLVNGSINALVTGFKNLYTFVGVRGYENIGNYSGYKLSCDYTWRLYNLRQGLWNPNIFIADIYASLFIDFAHVKSDYFSYGIELAAETWVGFTINNFNINPIIGLAFGKKEPITYFEFEFELPY